MIHNNHPFNTILSEFDPEIANNIELELDRQKFEIELIASENLVSRAVLEAQGSILTNKYAEGYPGKRYYGGCQFVDVVEELAIDRVKKLFNCAYANVQPHSGSQANQAVFFALLNPGDTILGMDLAAGGHLTHGAKPNISGKWFNAVTYGVNLETGLIEYDNVEKIAINSKPKLIIAGGSAYPRKIDFKRFREIADKVGAYLLVDMAHIAGLIVAGYHESPIEYAHIVTSTTHKTLRGPRGGIILSNDQDIMKKINSAIFPGIQGGPLMHIIAAKAVAFKEALEPEYKQYIKQVVDNAAIMASTLIKRGYDIVTNGTDTHLVLVDLRKHNLTGKDAELSLENAGLTCNKNAVPNDPRSPFITSGIRVGSPASTTRGFKEQEFIQVANLIADILDGLKQNTIENNQVIEEKTKQKVTELCKKFPIYS